MNKRMSADGEFVFVLYRFFEDFLVHYEIVDTDLLNYIKKTLELLKNDNYNLNSIFLKF